MSPVRPPVPEFHPAWAWFARPWVFPLFCAVLLSSLLTHSSRRPAETAGWSWPVVGSGDQPHYLLMLNSLLDDGDLDLKNNYEAVERGSTHAGYEHRGEVLARHVQGAGGRYSSHSPGLPLLLAVVLRPLRGSPLLESAALACTMLAVCAAAWCFRDLLRLFGAPPGWAGAVMVGIFLCPRFGEAEQALGLNQPWWYDYCCTLFCEPWLAACAAGAACLLLRGRADAVGRPLAAGVLTGLGILMKPPFALVAAPLGIWLLSGRRWRAAAAWAAPVLAAWAAMLVLNARWFAAPWMYSQPWIPGNFAAGFAGLLAGRERGLLWFMPLAIPALWLWPRFLRRGGGRAAVVAGMVGPYFLLIAAYGHWSGGTGYGPRYLLVIVPFLLLPLAVWPAVALGPRALQSTARGPPTAGGSTRPRRG